MNKRGGKRIMGGEVRNRFRGGLRYVFPSPEFSTPLYFSLSFCHFFLIFLPDSFCQTSFVKGGMIACTRMVPTLAKPWS